MWEPDEKRSLKAFVAAIEGHLSELNVKIQTLTNLIRTGDARFARTEKGDLRIEAERDMWRARVERAKRVLEGAP